MISKDALLEFLLTWGWAILVVVAAFGTMTYFGVPEMVQQSIIDSAEDDALTLSVPYDHWIKSGVDNNTTHVLVCVNDGQLFVMGEEIVDLRGSNATFCGWFNSSSVSGIEIMGLSS